MTNDKLNRACDRQDARALNILTIDDKLLPIDALDSAIRAKLMHVAVGVVGTGGIGNEFVRMLVDLSVYVSLQEAKTGMPNNSGHGVVIVDGATRNLHRYDGEACVWERANMVVPHWSHVATQAHIANVGRGDLTAAMGEPLTLRLLFDAQTSSVASLMAKQLCSRFSVWHAANTSLKEAMAAIRTTLIIPDIYPAARSEWMIYRSASVCKGWHDRIVDPGYFLRSSFEEGKWNEPRLAAPLAALCKERVEAVWHETAKAFHVPDPHGEDQSAADDGDLATSSDAADDFLSADRMTSLWFGNRKRPRRAFLSSRGS